MISTRSYDDRLATIGAVQDAGISLCSGGILGLGESDDDLSDAQLRRENLRRRASRFYFIDDVRKPTRAELEAAAHHGDGDGHGDGHEIGNGHNGDGNGHHSIEAGAATSGAIPSQTQ